MERIHNSKTEGFTFHKRVTQLNKEGSDYVFLAANPAFLSLVGLKKEEALGETIGGLSKKLKDLSSLWIEAYDSLPYEGGSLLFYSPSPSLGSMLKIRACSYGDGNYVALFEKLPLGRQQPEKRTATDLSRIISRYDLQALMGHLYQLTGIGSAIFDRRGSLLAESSIEDSCSCYERIRLREKSSSICIERDALSSREEQSHLNIVPLGESRWAATAPLILYGEHVGDMLFIPGPLLEERGENRSQKTDRSSPSIKRERAIELMALYRQHICKILQQDYRIKGVEAIYPLEKEKLESFKERNSYFSMAFNTIDTPLLFVSSNKELLYMNRGAEERIGQHLQEMEGQSIGDLISIVSSSLKEEEKKGLFKEGPITIDFAPLYDIDESFRGVVVAFSSQDQQKMAQEFLRETKERFSSLISHAPGILYRCKQDEDWTMEFISPGIEDLTGYPSWQFLQRIRSFASIIHPDDLENVMQRVDEAISEKRLFTTSYRIFHRRGDIRWVQSRGEGLFDAKGELSSIHGLIIDVHQQKEMEETLGETQEKYRLFFENAPFGVLHFDLDGLITACNNQFVTIIGSSQEALVGLNMLQLPDQKIVACVEKALLGEMASYEGEYHSVTAKKATPVRVIFSPLKPKGEEVVGGIGIVEDMTKRKRAEDALKKSQGQFKNLVEKLEEGICTFNAHEEFLFANPAAQRIFGLHTGTLVGRNLKEFVSLEEYKKIRLQTERRLQGYTDSYSFTIQRPDGEERILFGTYSPSDSDEEAIAIFGVFWDVTEHRKTEESLKESEERFKTYTHAAPIGIFVVNREGDYLEVNPQGCKMSGYTKEELFKKKAAHLIARSHRKRGLFLFRKVMAEGSSNNDLKMQKKDGSELWVRFSAVKINERQYMALCQDISQEKEAKERLDQIIQEQTLLLDNIEVQVWYLVDPETYGAVNRAHASFFGLQAKDLEHKELNAVLPKTSVLPLIRGNARVFQEKKTLTTEDLIVNGEGEERFLSITRIPKVNHIGLVEYVICSALDITEQMKAEGQIRYMRFHDILTHLYNRVYLEEEMATSSLEGQLPISIIMGDINGLKLVNDTYGFAVGDRLLLACAKVLKDSCREEDIVARWGGDEFVILLPKTSKDDAERISKKIKEESSRVTVESIPLQIALGTATKTTQREDLYQILKEAENWMHKQKLLESQSSRGAITSALLRTLGEKSHETEEHAWRMQRMALKVGEKIRLSSTELDRLSLLLTLHDIGKISIPEEILTKPGRLTEKEWEIIKTHPEIGYRIARSIEDFAHVASGILSHHERWDGRGYPQGLKGEEIPLLARIATIVDSFDVMTSYRPYKKIMSLQEAIMELRKCRGSQFDPRLVDLFIEMIEEYMPLSPP